MTGTIEITLVFLALLLVSCQPAMEADVLTTETTATPGITSISGGQAVRTVTPHPTRTPMLTIAHTAALSPTSISPIPTLTSTNGETQQTPAPTLVLHGDYLGQEPPGLEPRLFAPGFVSNPDSNEYSGSFSPDGSEYYFYRFSDGSPSRLLFSQLVDGQWTVPEEPGFSAGMTAYLPYVTLDNQRLYFATTDYPVPSSHPARLPAYVFVERTPNGWTQPQYAGQGMFISSTRDGQIYTTDMSSRNLDGKTYLAKVTVSDGMFTDYERLPIEASWGRQAHPCIALDESYVIFTVNDGSHLYVSFQKADGSWDEAIDLTQHGFDPQAGGPYISPDGKYLFFALDGDIWWVDIGVVENLKPVE